MNEQIIGSYQSSEKILRVRAMVFNASFNNIFDSYIMAVSFIGGGNQSILRKSLTCHKGYVVKLSFVVAND